MGKENKIIVPKADAKDITLEGVKSLVSMTPVIGGLLRGFMNLAVTPSLTQRQQVFFELITQTLEEHAAKIDNYSIEYFQNNEEFISLFVETQIIALKTHQKEKLKTLNTILKNSLEKEIEFDLQKHFLSIVDISTMSQLLSFKEIALNHFSANKKNSNEIFDYIHKKYDIKSILLTAIESDLRLKHGLIIDKNGNVNLTELGEQFWEFIKE